MSSFFRPGRSGRRHAPSSRAGLPAALAAAVGLVAAGCAGTGEAGAYDGPPRAIAVSLQGYGSAPFRLVSESHTAPVEQYSTEVDAPTTKILADEVMVALLEHLGELGFEGYAKPGTAPRYAGDGAELKAIQVVDGDARAWWAVTPSSGLDELSDFQTAMRDFISLYNAAQSWQSVDNALGADYFDRKKAVQGR